MREGLMVVTVLIGSALAFGAAPAEAAPGSLSAVSVPAAAAPVIEQAGYWKRRWRKGYYGPDVVLPDAGADVDVDVEAGVDVEVDAPIVIVLPPPRPLSCGEYRYWNGERCVDARYNTPYLGPK